MNLAVLDPYDPEFPHPSTALAEPDGLLAVGGNLQPHTLLSAYRRGIFPWYQDDDPILWWSPIERCVIRPDNFYTSTSLRRQLRQARYQIKSDTAFSDVMRACAAPRGDGGTWITPEMIEAYTQLHEYGGAHSVEVWDGPRLVGGIYGVQVGSLFCGESMFSRVNNGSKIAVAHLLRWMNAAGLHMLDCQLSNPHLLSLGAQTIQRDMFLRELSAAQEKICPWSFNELSADSWK
ncbi:leucyl/phenylalanyl-tRNA--protein transferase [Gammaproteobacteria bacterium]|nr:leucyl/phenylalanyl-tRNA--protein transferase [Gammaproteobacteria bacterium]|tara:strand:- start:948 stop:1649 length:702 start_codon:yes stop_codon:yes gene_type:complete